MSELIDNGGLAPKDLLKHLILQLHVGAAPAQVQKQLVRMLGQVPYGLVVEVEQELIEDGMPPQEVTTVFAFKDDASFAPYKDASPGEGVRLLGETFTIDEGYVIALNVTPPQDESRASHPIESGPQIGVDEWVARREGRLAGPTTLAGRTQRQIARTPQWTLLVGFVAVVALDDRVVKVIYQPADHLVIQSLHGHLLGDQKIASIARRDLDHLADLAELPGQGFYPFVYVLVIENQPGVISGFPPGCHPEIVKIAGLLEHRIAVLQADLTVNGLPPGPETLMDPHRLVRYGFERAKTAR